MGRNTVISRKEYRNIKEVGYLKNPHRLGPHGPSERGVKQIKNFFINNNNN